MTPFKPFNITRTKYGLVFGSGLATQDQRNKLGLGVITGADGGNIQTTGGTLGRGGEGQVAPVDDWTKRSPSMAMLPEMGSAAPSSLQAPSTNPELPDFGTAMPTNLVPISGGSKEQPGGSESNDWFQQSRQIALERVNGQPQNVRSTTPSPRRLVERAMRNPTGANVNRAQLVLSMGGGRWYEDQ